MRSRSKKTRRRERIDKLTRVVVMARARGMCEVSGCRERGEDCHHVQKRSQGGPASPDNLIFICRTHHEATDRPYALNRLVITALGQGMFASEVVSAASKWAARTGDV